MHSRFRIVALIAVLIACAILVWSGLSRPQQKREFPQGVQTLTGTLIPAEISLSRRGTHVLKVLGDDRAFVESSSVNLRTYELTTVVLTGTFHANMDPNDLPVFIATSARLIDLPTRTVDLPSVGLRVNVPPDWAVQHFDDGAAFSVTGSTVVLLRIMRSSLPRLPGGTVMFIGSYDAVRVNAPAGDQIVHVQVGRAVITFTWTPHDDESLTPAFVQVLRTMTALASSSSAAQSGSALPPPSSPSAGTGSTPRAQPCGGPAGVLCPAGSFCSVTEADGVGTCVPLQ